MTSKVRMAVIGLGWVATHRHIPGLLRHPAFTLIGVVDRHPGQAAKVARRFGLARWAESETLDGVDWLDEIDAICIAAPPTAHAALAIEAFQNGKHVLTEKPFALTLEEGRAMIEAAQRAGKRLAIVHNFQFSRAMRKLNRDLTAGTLGKILHISAVQRSNPRRRLPVWYEALPCGLFYDESPHFFYLLNALAGGKLKREALHAVANAKGLNTPDILSLAYRSETGIPLSLTCQFNSPVSEWQLLVSGEKALGIVDLFRDIYLRLPQDGAHGALDVLRTSFLAILQHAIQHIPNGWAFVRGRLDYGNDEVLSRFAQAIQRERDPVGIGPQEALTVLELQQEALAALEIYLAP